MTLEGLYVASVVLAAVWINTWWFPFSLALFELIEGKHSKVETWVFVLLLVLIIGLPSAWVCGSCVYGVVPWGIVAVFYACLPVMTALIGFINWCFYRTL